MTLGQYTNCVMTWLHFIWGGEVLWCFWDPWREASGVPFAPWTGGIATTAIPKHYFRTGQYRSYGSHVTGYVCISRSHGSHVTGVNRSHGSHVTGVSRWQTIVVSRTGDSGFKPCWYYHPIRCWLSSLLTGLQPPAKGEEGDSQEGSVLVHWLSVQLSRLAGMVWCSQRGPLAVLETERCVYVCGCVFMYVCVYVWLWLQWNLP